MSIQSLHNNITYSGTFTKATIMTSRTILIIDWRTVFTFDLLRCLSRITFSESSPVVHSVAISECFFAVTRMTAFPLYNIRSFIIWRQNHWSTTNSKTKTNTHKDIIEDTFLHCPNRWTPQHRHWQVS